MKKAILLSITLICLIGLISSCSSPAKQQRKASEAYMQAWNAYEFEKLCRNAVKLGMTSKEVLFQWGAPMDQKSLKSDQGQGMTFTYQLSRIMYFRGYNQSEAPSKAYLTVTIINDKVTEIREKK